MRASGRICILCSGRSSRTTRCNAATAPRASSWRRSRSTTAGAASAEARSRRATRWPRRWPGTCAAAAPTWDPCAPFATPVLAASTPATSAGPAWRRAEKVTGEAVYAADVRHQGQLEGVILRSPHPHARVSSVDLDPARALPGVRGGGRAARRGAAGALRGSGGCGGRGGRPAHRRAGARADRVQLPAASGRRRSGGCARREGAAAVYSGLRNVGRPVGGRAAPDAGPLARQPARADGAFSQRARKARRLIADAREGGDPLLVEGRWRTAGAGPHRPRAARVRRALARRALARAPLDPGGGAPGEGDRRALRACRTTHVHVVAEHVGGGFGAKLQLTAETVAAIELARAARRPGPGRPRPRRGADGLAGYRPRAEIELALLPGRIGRPARSAGARVRRLRVSASAPGSPALCRFIYPARRRWT